MDRVSRLALAVIPVAINAVSVSSLVQQTEATEVATFGPRGCVSAWRNSGQCTVRTNCLEHSVALESYQLRLLCIDQAGGKMLHTFEAGSFDAQETFETGITCDRCAGGDMIQASHKQFTAFLSISEAPAPSPAESPEAAPEASPALAPEESPAPAPEESPAPAPFSELQEANATLVDLEREVEEITAGASTARKVVSEIKRKVLRYGSLDIGAPAPAPASAPAESPAVAPAAVEEHAAAPVAVHVAKKSTAFMQKVVAPAAGKVDVPSKSAATEKVKDATPVLVKDATSAEDAEIDALLADS